MKNRFIPVNGINRKNYSGSVSMEALATMLLLLLLGICVFSLAISSTRAYEKIYEGKNAASGVRTALSFVEMKIRQNDISGAVRIENNPVNMEPSLLITEDYNGESYETWVYESGGKLREALMPAGQPPTDELSFEIANLSRFVISKDGNMIKISVAGNQQGKEISLESSIALRSD